VLPPNVGEVGGSGSPPRALLPRAAVGADGERRAGCLKVSSRSTALKNPQIKGHPRARGERGCFDSLVQQRKVEKDDFCS